MSLRIILSGDYACFTRPEMKVERVSYDVPTPGAIEGILKCIYWKPAIRYVIDKIVVYNPIKFVNVRRNEIKEKIGMLSVKNQMNGGDGSPVIYASELRTQRAGMLLRDVRYGIEFHFEMTGICSEKEDEREAKHYNILLRRLKNGQTFRQPSLGCREFSISDIELVEAFDLSLIPPELHGDVDLGYMLYGMKFDDGGIPQNGNWEAPKFSDNASAIFYRPHMIDGVIDVAKYREVVSC